MRGLSKSKRLKLSLATSFFLILSVPIVVYTVLTTDNADTRSGAESETVSVCNVTFPYVNPKTIEVGATIQIDVNGFAPTNSEQITAVLIKTSDNQILLDKQFDEPQEKISERITFKKMEADDVQIVGQLDTTGMNYPCIVSGVTTNLIRTQSTNNAPQFDSNPATDADPSNSILVGGEYLYLLNASDDDEDKIVYSYSFTPRAEWLNMSVIANGDNGDLKLKMEGKADKAGSYLVNVFVHDGYKAHLRSQSWVISVSPNGNDTPNVVITEPASDITVKKGENVKISWNANDQNQIVNYKLYYASNPGDQNTWKAIDEKLSYKVGSYILVTNQIEPGNYKFILQAQDNQSPPAIGTGISASVAILGDDGKDIPQTPQDPIDPLPDDNEIEKPEPDKEPEEEPEPDDGLVLTDPQIIGLNPSANSTITDENPTISATFIAGEDADIIIEEIMMLVDEKDVTQDIEISQLGSQEVTVIYRPTESLSLGEHKVYVSFSDSSGNEMDNDWNFTVEAKEEDISSWLDLLGFEISNRTVIIIVVGVGIVLLAIIVPWLLYVAWRDSGDVGTSNSNIYNIPPSNPNNGNTTKRDSYHAATMGNDDKYFIPPSKNAPINTAPPITKSKSTTPPKPQPPASSVSDSTYEEKLASQKYSPDSDKLAEALNTIAGESTTPDPDKKSKEKVDQPNSSLNNRTNSVQSENTKTDKKNTEEEISQIKALQEEIEKKKETSDKAQKKDLDATPSEFETDQLWKPRVIKPPKNDVQVKGSTKNNKKSSQVEKATQSDSRGDRSEQQKPPTLAEELFNPTKVKVNDKFESGDGTPPILGS